MRMKPWIRNTLAAAMTAALLAGCGGGDDNNNGPAPSYARLVSFGDSLSDVGTFRLGAIRDAGGGQFTVNDFNPATRPKAGTNWTEQLAYELALPTPCAARLAPTTCTNWAQGGAQVKADAGPLAPGLFAPDSVVKQVQSYLAAGGSFGAADLVTVLAGGNDAFAQLAALSAGTTTSAQAGAAMQQAGTELAALIRTQLLDKGAQRVALVLLPDISVSPLGLAAGAAREGISRLSLAFNLPLVSAFSNDPRVLVVDAFTASELQALDPARYGLTNSTQPACVLSAQVPNSLLCSTATVRPGEDVSRYWFADTVHLTPYGYQLLARTATDAMTKAGWLAPYGQRPCNSAAGATCTLAPLP